MDSVVQKALFAGMGVKMVAILINVARQAVRPANQQAIIDALMIPDAAQPDIYAAAQAMAAQIINVVRVKYFEFAPLFSLRACKHPRGREIGTSVLVPKGVNIGSTNRIK
eukprot:TRINITY_DN5748_c0_g1_i3.p1 TRINITY_DN5748_c0_g1~~TRINITY_DN5748_c0_g1_i3.p1  ORF type:complete len:110 (-),score=2.66 TRINITY_DN5748_c0_g1_i3:35-364(-)